MPFAGKLCSLPFMDAVNFLKGHHRELEAQFEELKEAKVINRKTFNQMADALAAHISVEEEIFYPAVKAKRTEDILLESLEEHLSLKRVLADLVGLRADAEKFSAKLHVLAEQAIHHHEEEEENLFPLPAWGDAWLTPLSTWSSTCCPAYPCVTGFAPCPGACVRCSAMTVPSRRKSRVPLRTSSTVRCAREPKPFSTFKALPTLTQAPSPLCRELTAPSDSTCTSMFSP